MKSVFWQRLDRWARRLTPFGLTLILVLVNVLPMQIPGMARVMPLLPLIAIYHWAVNRPHLMPVYAVFIIGLLQDALSGAPMGLNILIYLAVYGIVAAQRRFLVGKSFAVVWLGFTLITAGAMFVGWALASSLFVALVDPGALFFQYLVSLGVFPFLTWGFVRWQRTFLRQM